MWQSDSNGVKCKRNWLNTNKGYKEIFYLETYKFELPKLQFSSKTLPSKPSFAHLITAAEVLVYSVLLKDNEV